MTQTQDEQNVQVSGDQVQNTDPVTTTPVTDPQTD
jgi:hypothetical protein